MAKRYAVQFTPAELSAVLDAISQMTYGNANDYGEWRMQTGRPRREWSALLRGEAKLADAWKIAEATP